MSNVPSIQNTRFETRGRRPHIRYSQFADLIVEGYSQLQQEKMALPYILKVPRNKLDIPEGQSIAIFNEAMRRSWAFQQLKKVLGDKKLTVGLYNYQTVIGVVIKAKGTKV